MQLAALPAPHVTAIGALYAPLQVELASLPWRCSFPMSGLGVHRAGRRGRNWRPDGAEVDELLAHLRNERERWIFAIVVAATVSAAFLTSWARDLHRAWALLAIVIVMVGREAQPPYDRDLMLARWTGVGIKAPARAALRARAARAP